jgi:RNA polymerase sigma factor (sigma-70 family)
VCPNGESFPTTRSAVLGARSGDPAERERSWRALARAYWKPAYKHLRVRWGASVEDAEDTVQSFFERAMEKDFFAGYEPERARFRTFFRVCLDRHAANEVKARGRRKRGGDRTRVALEAEEELGRAGGPAWESPEECFEREWRREAFASAVLELRRACEVAGKMAAYEAFERYDLAEPSARPTYDALAEQMVLPVTTITNHLSYVRRELRRIAVAKLEEITATNEELRAETRALFG